MHRIALHPSRPQVLFMQKHDPRRAFMRFLACELDLSHEPPDTPLPEPVAAGTEPYLIVGAMAGG